MLGLVEICIDLKIIKADLLTIVLTHHQECSTRFLLMFQRKPVDFEYYYSLSKRLGKQVEKLNKEDD